jgi:hypothetical protein
MAAGSVDIHHPDLHPGPQIAVGINDFVRSAERGKRDQRVLALSDLPDNTSDAEAHVDFGGDPTSANGARQHDPTLCRQNQRSAEPASSWHAKRPRYPTFGTNHALRSAAVPVSVSQGGGVPPGMWHVA